jgi:hypothetical protein
MSARVVVGRAAQVLAGLMAAALVAEGAYWLRDHGAFPHVNFYVPDAQLGVRLRPGATERISFGGNPVTRIQINGDGYRGAELPPPRADEILVVGDSQAFGLGVEENETFSARLVTLTGRPVVNAGVPTYGPDEYDAVVEEMLARRKPSVVVYTVNMANDLFETEHPNRERHVVWDGWAVRKDGAAPAPRAFPGRSWLFGRSHLVFALRKMSHGTRPDTLDQGVASEGTWTDLVGAGKEAQEQSQKARANLRKEATKSQQAKASAEDLVADVEQKLGRAVRVPQLGIPDDEKLLEAGYVPQWLHASRASVGDIVNLDYGEEARSIPVTAELLEHAGAFRAELEEALREKGSRKERKLLKDWQTRTDELRALQMAPAQVLRHSSPLLPHVVRMKALAEKHGARLVVLVLPLDVMVSSAEWAKYGAAAVDLGPARRLAEDLARASEEVTVAALDATPALVAAEPGAFLAGDLHLTPKGHDAVARALAAKIGEAPPEFPSGALPADRTPPPAAENWYELDQNDGAPVLESAPETTRCAVYHTVQWWRIACDRGKRDAQPRGLTLVKGGRGDALAFTTTTGMYLVAPVLPGDTLEADFEWSDAVQHLVIDSADGARFSTGPARPGGRTGPSAVEARILGCFKKNRKSDRLSGVDLGADADCARTYGDDCDRLLECSAGSPTSPPDCPPGWVNAGAFHFCHQLCGPGHACTQGQRCDAWPGAHVCE